MPAGTEYVIEDLYSWEPQNRYASSTKYVYKLARPQILLYCGNEICQREMLFACTTDTPEKPDSEDSKLTAFLTFRCRHCLSEIKTYSLQYRNEPSIAKAGRAIKFGEVPPFGPHIPSRVISLIGPDRDIFLRGYRSETLGLGIGAFAYYRRVVENQKGRLIVAIGKVAKKLGAATPVLELFDAAAKETQFSTAVAMVKDAIPDSLKVEGHNPLTLLHKALSEGMHAQTDAECLELASDIRVVLPELADRIGQALKKKAGLTDSVSRLLARKAAKTAPEQR